MLALAAGSADAIFPGDNGEIAFSKENFRNGTPDIFTVGPDGTGQDRLTSGSDYSPSYSADGQKVVFVGLSGETEQAFGQDIFVMDADGSNMQQLTNTRAYESSPSFFPDGETIAFARYSNRNGSDVFKINLDGTGLTKLTNDAMLFKDSVAVSPDGEKIAYSRYNRSSDIFLMNADGSEPTNLTKTGRVDEFEADWSPSADRLAFTSYRFSGMMGVAARAADALEEGASAPDALAREAIGSKESVAEPTEDVEVSVINADGTGRRDLTAGRAFDVSPAFSPDGTRIVFAKMTFDGRSERSDLFVMRSDGSNKRQITDTPRAFEYGADWQPLPAPEITPAN